MHKRTARKIRIARQLSADGQSVEQIAEALGCRLSSARKYVELALSPIKLQNATGVPGRQSLAAIHADNPVDYLHMKFGLSREDASDCIEMISRIGTSRDVARSFGISETVVHKAAGMMIRRGWIRPGLANPARTAVAGSGSVEESVRIVADMTRNGFSLEATAAQLKVTERTVSRLRKRAVTMGLLPENKTGHPIFQSVNAVMCESGAM